MGQADTVAGLVSSSNVWLSEIALNTRSLRLGPGYLPAGVGGMAPGAGTIIVQMDVDPTSSLTVGQQAAAQSDKLLANRAQGMKAGSGLPRHF